MAIVLDVVAAENREPLTVSLHSGSEDSSKVAKDGLGTFPPFFEFGLHGRIHVIEFTGVLADVVASFGDGEGDDFYVFLARLFNGFILIVDSVHVVADGVDDPKHWLPSGRLFDQRVHEILLV